MRRLVRSAVLALVLAPALAGGHCIAQVREPAPEQVAAHLARAALEDAFSFALLESLTTEIGQRLAGTEAHARAVEWARAKLDAAGFENVHAESFSMPAWIRGAE